MSEMERMVWAAAFAALAIEDNEFRRRHGHKSLENGFSFAEKADVVVAQYRAAMVCEDSKYLTPVEEGWKP